MTDDEYRAVRRLLRALDAWLVQATPHNMTELAEARRTLEDLDVDQFLVGRPQI